MKKLRKDKINTAVYAAMEVTASHPYVVHVLNQSDTSALETHRKGFDMDYMKMEHRLHAFFTTYWRDRLPQLREKLGRGNDYDALESMKRIIYCKGIAYNKKRSHQCHHFLCPMCHHRKHYNILNDLKPYLD